MKKIIIIFIVLFVCSAQKTFAQLEVIDKIAEVLIPGITTGVKSILDQGGSKAKLKKEMKSLQKDITNDVKIIISSLEKDGKNLEALNSLFKITGGLFEDSASMKTLTNSNFLEAINQTNSHELYKETAFIFARHWRQLEEKKTKLSNISAVGGSNPVTDDISGYVDVLDRNLINLKSAVNLIKDPKANMSYEDSKDYVENLGRARDYIVDLNGAIRSINIQLSSRIGSLERSIKEGKKKIDEIGSQNIEE